MKAQKSTCSHKKRRNSSPFSASAVSVNPKWSRFLWGWNECTKSKLNDSVCSAPTKISAINERRARSWTKQGKNVPRARAEWGGACAVSGNLSRFTSPSGRFSSFRILCLVSPPPRLETSSRCTNNNHVEIEGGKRFDSRSFAEISFRLCVRDKTLVNKRNSANPLALLYGPSNPEQNRSWTLPINFQCQHSMGWNGKGKDANISLGRMLLCEYLRWLIRIFRRLMLREKYI